MKTHGKSSAITALGTTTATTETSIGTLTVSAKCRRIIGLWAYVVGGAGVTTLENISGIVRFNSGDVDLTPMEFPLDTVEVLTNGIASLSPRIFPVNIGDASLPNAVIEAFVTLDLAQTIAHKARWGMIFEGE